MLAKNPAVPYFDLHDTKKLDENIERVQAAHNNHWGLKRVRYHTPHTATQNIHKKKKKKKKLVEKERQQKKAKYTSIKQRKGKAHTKLSDNLYSVSSTEEAQS